MLIHTTNLMPSTVRKAHLRVVHHVHPLVDDALGALPEELQDVLHLRLVGEPPQADAVLPGAGGDHLLRQHGGRGLRGEGGAETLYFRMSQ